MSNSTQLREDNTFGPFSEPLSRQYFDFTLLFEQSIFSIGPAAVLIVCAAPRITYLLTQPRAAKWSTLAVIKLLLLACLIGLTITDIALWTHSPRTKASVAAAALEFASTVTLAVLSYAEHLHSARPSLIINAYLLLAVPFGFTETRTLWLRYSASLASVQTAISGVKLLLLIAEAVEKRAILLPAFKSTSAESTTGLYSRSVFWWLNPLFIFGYKGSISTDTLTAIDDELLTSHVYAKFKRYYSPARNRSSARSSLLLSMLRANWLALAAAVCPRLFLIFFRFMQPLLIRSVSTFVAAPVSELSTNEGWGLTAAFGLVYLGLALSTAVYYHQVYRTITMVRGSLVATIFEKTTRMPTTDLNESAAVTLMSTDVQKICDALAQGHEMWAGLIEIAIGVWLLSKEIGVALLGTLAITIVAVLATMSVSKRMGAAMGSWMAAVQTRIDATANALGSMKEIKMLGLSPSVSVLLRNLRIQEIAKSMPSRRLMAGLIGMANIPPSLGSPVAFIIYVTALGDSDLNVSRAFAALSLISLVTQPVKTVIFAYGPLVEALACFRRIETYVSSPEHKNAGLSRDFSDEPQIGGSDIELRPLSSRKGLQRSAVMDADDVSFGWKDGDLPVIKPMTISLVKSEFTFLIGPVGCGKSTLIKGLLGELPTRSGRVRSTIQQVAYVDQTTWIQHKSVRDNILGNSLYERDWYEEVVNACALHTDIAHLPRRDDTIVGSSGSSLSGGQKLRVALARAVYSRAALLFMDDCFSGIDPENEAHIFSSLLGRTGVLRRHGVTVLLATHAVHRLSFADRVIALNQDGTVLAEGAPDVLLRREDFLSLPGISQKPGDEQKEQTSAPLTVKEIAEQQKTEDTGSDSMARNVGDLRVYKHYFASAGWLNIAGFVTLIAGFAVFSRFSDFWVVIWTQAVKDHGNSVNGTYVAVFTVFGLLTLLAALFTGLQICTQVAPQSARTLHERLLQTTISAPWHFFTSRHTGQTLNRFSQDLSLVDTELPVSLMTVVGPVFLAIIQLVFICISAAYFTTLLPAIVAVLYVLQRYYLRTSRQLRLLELESKSPLFTHFLETLQGLTTIRAFGWEEYFADENTKLLDRSQKPFYLLFCVQRWLALVLDMIVAVLAVLLMVMVVKLRDTLDPGLVALALLNVMSFNNNLTAIIQMWTSLETSMGAIARLKSFSETTPSEIPMSSQSPPLKWPNEGRIEFHNFSAAYSLDTPDSLKNISLNVLPGQRVGICGVSGSGKSSLVCSLLRLLEVTSGSMTIDGVDITELPRQTVRESLNAIPQHTFFLKGTLRENVDLLGQASDTEIESALRAVGLWNLLSANNPISNPSGSSCLDTAPNLEQVLSHGQRQLFCLARALVRPSSIVLLDEVTASVDAATDGKMQKIIRERFRDTTMIVIAHRLQTIQDLDRVVVLEQGKIMEVGNPRELLHQQGSAFRALWES